MMLSIVIPNYNSANLLEKNLPALIKLLEKSKLDFEIIVSDDCSTDDSILKIEELKNSFQISRSEGARSHFKFQIIQNPVNTGFAGNVDRGIRAAVGEIVFTIKTDSLPKSSDYFSLMLKHFENPKTFAVSAALETVENGKKEIRGQGVLIFHRGFFLHFRTYDDYKKWLQTMRTTRNKTISNFKFQISNSSAWPDGSASAFRRDLYLKIGGFDPLYNPFYWEDVDLGYRATKAGYRIDFEPKAILVHTYESGAISRHFSKDQIRTVSLRNQFIFVRKNASFKQLLLHFLWLPYHFTVALKNQDRLFFRAYCQAFLKWPEIIKKRISPLDK